MCVFLWNIVQWLCWLKGKLCVVDCKWEASPYLWCLIGWHKGYQLPDIIYWPRLFIRLLSLIIELLNNVEYLCSHVRIHILPYIWNCKEDTSATDVEPFTYVQLRLNMKKPFSKVDSEVRIHIESLERSYPDVVSYSFQYV